MYKASGGCEHVARASLRVRRCGAVRAAGETQPGQLRIGICCSTTRHRLTDSEPTSPPACQCRGSRTAAAPLVCQGAPDLFQLPGSSIGFNQTKATPISGARAAMPGAPGEEVFYCLDDKLEDNTTPSSDLNHAFPPEYSISYTGNYQSQVHWKENSFDSSA